MNMNGLMPTLDFTSGGQKLPPTLGMYLAAVDENVPGFLKPATGFFQAPYAKDWKG
jgi:hypothetical protein